MKRGEVWWVNLDPSVGEEIKKQCPAVIASNDAANRHLNRVQVVPLTSKVGRIYPSEASAHFQERRGKAMADQLSTVSKRRLINRGGQLSAQEMAGIEQALRVQLGL